MTVCGMKSHTPTRYFGAVRVYPPRQFVRIVAQAHGYEIAAINTTMRIMEEKI
jgi:hypothetical protein